MRRGSVSVWRGGQESRVRYLPAPMTVLTMDSVLAMDVSAQRTSQVSPASQHVGHHRTSYYPPSLRDL